MQAFWNGFMANIGAQLGELALAVGLFFSVFGIIFLYIIVRNELRNFRNWLVKK